MRRLVLSLLALCCAPVLLQAGQVSEIPLGCAPASAAGEPPVFEPAQARPLTYAEQRDLRLMFAAMEGDWQGSMVEQVCMLSGTRKEHRYVANMTIRATRDELQMSGDYQQPEQNVRRHFSLRLFLTAEGLRVDQRSAAGEVELLQAERQLLDFVQYYRTIHKREEAKKATPVLAGDRYPLDLVADAQGSVLRLGAKADEEGAQDKDDKDDASAPDDKADTSGNADKDAGEDKEEKKLVKRAVVARQQRVILELPSQRKLRLSRHFFTQGVYSGNISWQLRRN